MLIENRDKKKEFKMGNQKLLLIKEVAEILRVSTRSVFRYIKDGDLKSIKLSGKTLIRKSELDKFINEREK